MSDEITFPPFRDLSPGRLAARKQHLLREIGSEQERPRFRPATLNRRDRRTSWKSALLVGASAIALVVACVAIAAGFGAFRGISAAQHTRVGANVLPPRILASIEHQNAHSAAYRKEHHTSWPPSLLPNTARVLGKMPDASKVYGLTDTRGDLCLIGEIGGSCGPLLSKSRPITFGLSNRSPTTGGTLVASGVAIDGVTSVSFRIWSKEVTAPVKNNVWIYKNPKSTAKDATCIVAHFADGSTVSPFRGAPCPKR